MRQIKFRAWELDTFTPVGRMYYDVMAGKGAVIFEVDEDEFEGNGTIDPTFSCVFGEVKEVRPPIIMQFTGLTDKNGKEIYEGDILRDPEGIGVVYYYAPQFVVQTEDDIPFALAKGQVNVKQLQETEVIGNIYEHPHLLTPHHEPTTSRAQSDGALSPRLRL